MFGFLNLWYYFTSANYVKLLAFSQCNNMVSFLRFLYSGQSGKRLKTELQETAQRFTCCSFFWYMSLCFSKISYHLDCASLLWSPWVRYKATSKRRIIAVFLGFFIKLSIKESTWLPNNIQLGFPLLFLSREAETRLDPSVPEICCFLHVCKEQVQRL